MCLRLWRVSVPRIVGKKVIFKALTFYDDPKCANVLPVEIAVDSGYYGTAGSQALYDGTSNFNSRCGPCGRGQAWLGMSQRDQRCADSVRIHKAFAIIVKQ